MLLTIGARAITLIPKNDIFLSAPIPAGESAIVIAVTSVGYLVELFTADGGGIYGDYLFYEVLAEKQLALWLRLTVDADDEARFEQRTAWVRLIAASCAADKAFDEDLSFVSVQAVLDELRLGAMTASLNVKKPVCKTFHIPAVNSVQ